MTSRTATILIVDDEPQNRKLLDVLLRPAGYLTISAASGEEALALVAQQAPDLILLDIMMPGMDGYAVARTLKSNAATAHIPIIMVTVHIDRATRLEAFSAGVEEFLTKPVDRTELWLRVRNLLRLKALGDCFQENSLILEQQAQAHSTELQLFRTAMDSVADAVFLVNRATMRFVEVNATACSMLGYTREELLRIGPEQVAGDALGQLEILFDALIASDESEDLSETWIRSKDGSKIPVEVHRQSLSSGDNWIIVAVVRDISRRKETEKRLHHLAHYDALTGLPNRAMLHDSLRTTLARAADSDWEIAVMSVDLDHFKQVNDTLGHAIGDELLVQFSDRLMQCLRIRDTVGRLGADEFALLLVMQDAQQGAEIVAGKIRNMLREPFDVRGQVVTLTASIGITIHPGDASDPEMLLKFADIAMHRAKQAGRDTFRFFTAQMNAEALARLELETALRKAVENGEFVLYYQPKVQLDSGRIAGLEALLRWQRPEHGLVPPNDFIPALEETGLITRVGSWVIAEACRQMRQWMLSPIGPVQISVNVSARQFNDGELEADVVKALGDNDISGELLELELTESTLMADTEHTIASLRNLKQLGVQISIDDFGTGYSSLAYLRRFPIDKLKIDIAFIHDIPSNRDEAAIVLAIISMAQSLKLGTIAEGVETAAQLAYLQHHRCDQMQGYYFSPPVPVSALEPMLLAGKRLSTPGVDAAGAPRQQE